MPTNTPLSVQDRFEIFEQLNLHQRYIDNDASLESVRKYHSLYWPEAKFILHDVRHSSFEGPDGMKQLYDYAHSVFPLVQWKHSLGNFVIEGGGDEATVEWQWVVSWRAACKAPSPRARTTTAFSSATASGSARSAPATSIRTGRSRCFSRTSTRKRRASKRHNQS